MDMDNMSYAKHTVPNSKNNSNTCFPHPWTYGSNDPCSSEKINEKNVCQNITPSYYPDLTDMIGKRPAYSVRSTEYPQPTIFTQNKGNLMNNNFACSQPNWGRGCN